jgi:hypothetical protein
MIAGTPFTAEDAEVHRGFIGIVRLGFLFPLRTLRPVR